MRWILPFACAGMALAQGTTPKKDASEYPVHAEAGGVAVGADFTIHSFSRGEEMFIARDYLVVEVALFPPKKATVEVNHGRFGLRINGRKTVLPPQPASMVAASLEHPEWSQEPPRAIGQVGPVILGAPRRGTPFPGGRGSTPVPRPIPPPENPGGVERETADPARLVVETELPQGVFDGPVSGFLYFAYRGKTKGIKRVELLYDDTVLKLR